MRHLYWLPLGGAMLALLAGGCEPANRYGAGANRTTTARGISPQEALKQPGPNQPAAAVPAPPPPPPPLDPGLAWLDPTNPIEPPLRLEFIHADDHPQEWSQLKQFWTEGPAPSVNPAFLGLSPLPAAAVAAGLQSQRLVRIKVPLGVDDPTPHIPLSNQPTAGKWALGKQLFFDSTWLEPGQPHGRSCASCHDPEFGFTSRQFPGPKQLDTPTLFNVAYNNRLFWDGRAGTLEEVVQRTLEDERPTSTNVNRHVWGGVIESLRNSKGPQFEDYREQFRKVFGTRPTADGVGKALATYLRTILVGDSVYDRAIAGLRQRKGTSLEPADFEKVLDEATVKAWKFEPPTKVAAAKELHRGYRLFMGQARCVHCHSGANFTDNGFHNLGVGDNPLRDKGQETGRFTALPVGLKDAQMIGAYKTPTLRGLLRKERYFHDGLGGIAQDPKLFPVIAFHVQGGTWNPYLDMELRDPKDPSRSRHLGLKEDEVRALMLFLYALDGEPVAAVVREPQPPVAANQR